MVMTIQSMVEEAKMHERLANLHVTAAQRWNERIADARKRIKEFEKQKGEF